MFYKKDHDIIKQGRRLCIFKDPSLLRESWRGGLWAQCWGFPVSLCAKQPGPPFPREHIPDA